MQQVTALLPADRGLSLAEALAEPSPAKVKATATLDSKAQKYVRRWLEKRRHAYRDRRVTRASKLMTDLALSEQQYVAVLTGWLAAKPALAAAGASADDLLLVLGEVEKAAAAHTQLAQLAAQAAAVQEPAAQRRCAADFVLEPLVSVVGCYGTFFSNHWARSSVVEHWLADPAIARALQAASTAGGGLKIDELLQTVAARVQAYKVLVERLEVLLEEERSPTGRDRADQETSERIQGLSASVALACARLQSGLMSALNGAQVRALAALYKLGDNWVASNPHRRFVTQERVRARAGPKSPIIDDCLLLVFSDMLVLAAGRKSKKEGVLAQLELTATDLEDDSLQSWDDADQTASSTLSSAVASVDEPGPKRGFLGTKKKSEKSQEEQPVVLTTSPDLAVWNSQSPAFRLVAGEQKWLIQCADKASRLALTECILNQKFK